MLLQQQHSLIGPIWDCSPIKVAHRWSKITCHGKKKNCIWLVSSYSECLPLLRSSSSSSSSFFLSCCPWLLFSEATHWISSLVSFHSPLWSNWGFGASLMKSSVSASAKMAACSLWRKSYSCRNRGKLITDVSFVNQLVTGKKKKNLVNSFKRFKMTAISHH